MSELERNVEALIRSAALRPREAQAKARFLGGLAPAARPRPWPAAAAAAVLLLATLGSIFSRLEPPTAPDAGARPAAQEPAWIAVDPLGPDATITLKARLLAGRTRLLNLDGAVDLPDRFMLFVAVRAETEAFDGRRLRPDAKLVYGGFAPVVRGRIALDVPWATPSLVQIQATLAESNQNPESLAAMKGKYPIREWTFRASGWDHTLAARLEPAAEEIEAAAAELGALLKDVESACATEERWRREAPRLVPAARALRERLERLPARALFPATADTLLYAARNLDGDSAYFAWKAGVFEGPVSYHADQRKLKTFRGDEWTFASLRRYAREAPAVAARELALWIVKDLRRAGPRPELAALAKRTPFAERLGAGSDLDALEAEIRR
jgi:hypothetical protein